MQPNASILSKPFRCIEATFTETGVRKTCAQPAAPASKPTAASTEARQGRPGLRRTVKVMKPRATIQMDIFSRVS